MSAPEFIVCDSCGALEVRHDYEPNEKWKCQTCGSDSAWLYADRMKAWEHASQIAGEA